MVALATFFAVVVLSLIAARIASVALTLTGLSREAARFQARSALSGVGFTTSEAESVVSHPVRRRVVMMLMLVGSAGIVTGVATLMLSFVGAGGDERLARLGALLVGLVLVLVLARSPLVDRGLSRVVAWALKRWTNVDTRDYASLLHLTGDYAVMELKANDSDWVCGRTLRELGLREEGVAVLAVQRPDGVYIGAPIPDTPIGAGDTLILYGRSRRLRELDDRRAGPAGDRSHRTAVAEQRRVIAEESERDADEAPARQRTAAR